MSESLRNPIQIPGKAAAGRDQNNSNSNTIQLPRLDGNKGNDAAAKSNSRESKQTPISPKNAATGLPENFKQLKAVVEKPAQEIAFFGTQTGESSPVSKLDYKPTRDLPPYTLDEDEDANSSGDDGNTDEEAEERVVAEFVSEIGDNRRNSCHEGENVAEEDEEASQQFSVDDVTDDEEGDQEDANGDCPLTTRQSQQDDKTPNLTTVTETDLKFTNGAKNYLEKTVQAATAYDSTNYCSSAAETADTHSRLNNMRPDPLGAISTQQKLMSGTAPQEHSSQHAKTEETIGMKTLNGVPSRKSLKKEPQLDRENFVNGHIRKFLAHVETREIKQYEPGSSKVKKSQRVRRTDQTCPSEGRSTSGRSKVSSTDSEPNKDNEDPNDIVKKPDAFDPKEKRESFEGWDLYKKTRISFAPVRRYQYMVDQDYKKNKVTVCAHLQNIYTSFCVKRGKLQPTCNNYFDIEKWLAKMHNSVVKKNEGLKDPGSPLKELKRINTLAAPFYDGEEPNRKDGHLLSKSNSTAHIPESSRAKNVRRTYANFDKDLAVKMFGYRIIFQRAKMNVEAPDPHVSQAHKPLQRFVQEILGELTQMYQPLHRYHSKQRVLIPIPDSDEDENSPTPSEPFSGENSARVAHQNQHKSNDSQAEGDALKSEKTPITIKNAKKQGEIVVIRNRFGERQSFLKKSKNLMWHCNPPERQQSATSNQKRNSYVKTSSVTGSQYNNTGSPSRTTISPKKYGGIQNSYPQSKFGNQPNFKLLKSMNQVRYVPPRQGLSHPPSQSMNTSLKFGSTGIPGNTGGYNYQRQNSFRKGHQRIRGDSAKGGRGLRQSMDAHQNPAYRLINQSNANRSSSDQNFIMNGGEPHNDHEVAKITGQQQAQSNNVVYLKDPKHIQGFGSNVVHVNVSCGQTVPPNNQPAGTTAQTKPSAATNPACTNNQTNTAIKPAAITKVEEEDEDAQTFIIQLTEDQTRQLASGNLKLNGVPIPKDLSNLNYDQIMALLDSVNFSSNQKSGGATSTAQSSQQKAARETPKNTKVTPLGSRDYTQQFQSENARRLQQNQQKTSQTFNQSVGGREDICALTSKKYGQSYSSAKANPFMAGTSVADQKSLSFNQQTTNTNMNIYRQQQQQTYYAQGASLAAQMDKQGLRKGMVTNPGALMATSIGKPPNSSKSTSKNNHSFNGREIGQQHYTSASQKPVQRADSATRRKQTATTTGASGQIGFGGMKSENAHLRQQRMMIQKGRSAVTEPAPTIAAPAPTSVGSTVTRNKPARNASVSDNPAMSGSAGAVKPGQMSHQEWDMLSLLQQQQQQLKNAQKFLQHSSGNLEHKRKLQAAQNVVDDTVLGNQISQTSERATPGQQPPPASNVQMSKSATGSEGFNRAGFEQIHSHSRPIVANQMVRNSIGGATTGAISGTGNSQKMMTQQSYNPYIRSGGVQANGTTQQRSMSRLNSKKRLNNNTNSSVSNNSKNGTHGIQRSNSRGYLKSGPNQPTTRTNSHQSAHANKVSSTSSSYTEGRQPNLVFPQRDGKVNTTLIAHENKLISNHAQNSGKNICDQQARKQQFYGSVSGGSTCSASLQNTTIRTGQSTSQGGPGQVMSTKNCQQSKTSIELEYSKFENITSNYMISTSSKKGPAQKLTTSQPHAKMQLPPHDRGTGATSQYYHTRISEETSIPGAQKLRINQQALNNNLNYTNQSSTHKRKIESALAQSAMNAIQGPATSGSQSTAIGGVSSFLHLEQKPYSQPYNNTVTEPQILQNNYNKAAASITQQSRKPAGAKPQFIMRNTHQGLNNSTEPVMSRLPPGTQPLNAVPGGGVGKPLNSGHNLPSHSPMRTGAQQPQQMGGVGGGTLLSSVGASRSIHLSRE